MVREISAPLEAINDETRRLAEDMLDTMYDAPGIGLAAIQIGVPRRMLVIEVDSDLLMRNLVLKMPVGVVGAISPWNFPLVLSVRKVAPALAAGCTTILKPASQTPLCNIAFAECCDAAKLPNGVFQLINGPAGTAEFHGGGSRWLDG